MGSRANVIMAITKEDYTRSMLLEDLPKLLKDQVPTAFDDAMYWRWECINWSTSMADVLAVIEYCAGLDEAAYAREDTNPTHGGVELWDEGHNDSWGDAGHFNIWTVQRIESPFDPPIPLCTPATT